LTCLVASVVADTRRLFGAPPNSLPGQKRPGDPHGTEITEITEITEKATGRPADDEGVPTPRGGQCGDLALLIFVTRR
jgi:hypothetical protein